MDKKNILDKLLDNSGYVVDWEIENSVLESLMDEIDLIRDPNIVSFVRSMLLKAEAFWTAPSAFTETTNPPDEHELGGEVLHTKRVVRTAIAISDTYRLSQFETDIVIAACLLHEITRSGVDDKGRYFENPKYPYLIDDAFRQAKAMDLINSESQSSVHNLTEEVALQILRMVRCHLGTNSPIPETQPQSLEEIVVCLAVKLASNLHWIIDGDNIDVSRWIG